MSLNFKSLRRSFSLRNNVSDQKKDKNVSIGPNYTPKLNLSLDAPSNNKKLQPNSFDDIHLIEPLNEGFNAKMEYFIPYTRLKPNTSTGMQLTNVRRNEQEWTEDVNSGVGVNVVSSKKIQKYVLNQQFKQLKSSSEIEFQPTKMSKKQLKVAQDQLKKMTKINIHLSALFSAVENGQLEKTKSILESTDVNVNCINSDALSPLDIAVLTNNRSLTKILLENGASHGAQFKNCESLGNHLNSLLEDALNKINDFTCGSYDDVRDQDTDKQIDFWQRRANSLQRILRGWVQSTTPDLPNYVVVDVTSSTSVAVKVQESLTGAITTKFKIQWSLDADFGNIIDEREINDLTNNDGMMCSTFHLYNLNHGQRYYFRALSGNIKGWSEHRISSPRSVIPSSWQDVVNKTTTSDKKSLDELLAKINNFRRMTSSEIQLGAPSSHGMSIKKKATIKQLFTATSKFQKHLKRGIYLACLLYHDGKVLVTNDDSLPVIEIDETYPNNFHNEHPWLMKISCNWDIVKPLRNEMGKYSSSVNQFRLKLLSAISQMQSAIGLKDLGFFYYKSLQDSQGTVVLSCINHIKDPKSISVLNSRWISLRKLQRKLLPISDGSSINDVVLASIQNQIEYHQTASIKLAKGLYVGYLKMHCSMEQMNVVVPKKTPNVLPHHKIRDNPHVCAEEWEVLQDAFDQNEKSEMQKRFVEAFSSAAMRLFKWMGVSTECMLKHKLYNVELIKLSHDVSFLIICPPIEQSCSLMNYPPGGQREMLLQRADLLSIPTQAFEMGQLFTYDNESIRQCARLSIIVDLETTEANHSHREAFSICEAQAAKEHLNQLHGIKSDLSEYWKNIRWLLNVMTFTRNRCTDTVSLRSILNVEAVTQRTEPIEEKTCKQSGLPACDDLNRRSPCRFSWPNSNRKKHISTLLSKSDQHLNFVMSKVNCGRTNDVDGSRRNSADAKYPDCLRAAPSDESVKRFVDRYALCKSDETLSTSRASFSPLLQRKRSKTINASICSPKCIDCDTTSSSTHHADESEYMENKSLRVACSVANYLTNESGKVESIESNSNHSKRFNKEILYDFVDDNSPQFGTIQVYIANELGAGDGICLRLHVTTQTTAREIIDLVVMQCNRSVLQMDEKPTMRNELDAKDFCLFAIFGNVGRCVPDNFRPLQLQNPWKKGRLYVRRTNDIPAEIEHSQHDVHKI